MGTIIFSVKLEKMTFAYFQAKNRFTKMGKILFGSFQVIKLFGQGITYFGKILEGVAIFVKTSIKYNQLISYIFLQKISSIKVKMSKRSTEEKNDPKSNFDNDNSDVI